MGQFGGNFGANFGVDASASGHGGARSARTLSKAPLLRPLQEQVEPDTLFAFYTIGKVNFLMPAKTPAVIGKAEIDIRSAFKARAGPVMLANQGLSVMAKPRKRLKSIALRASVIFTLPRTGIVHAKPSVARAFSAAFTATKRFDTEVAERVARFLLDRKQ